MPEQDNKCNIYWRRLHSNIHNHVKQFKNCQQAKYKCGNYGTFFLTTFEYFCVNVLNMYTLKGKNHINNSFKFMFAL